MHSARIKTAALKHDHVTHTAANLGFIMLNETIGGELETLLNELQVTPRFKDPSLVVTTTTNSTSKANTYRDERLRERGGGYLVKELISSPLSSWPAVFPLFQTRVLSL